MQHLEVSGAVRHIYMSLGVKGLITIKLVVLDVLVFTLLVLRIQTLLLNITLDYARSTVSKNSAGIRW
jgi:hypothetical protein